MNQNTIPRTAHQRCRSKTGQVLERAYIYLPPDTWEALYACSRSEGISASQFVAALIPTDHGKSKIKENYDHANTRND